MTFQPIPITAGNIGDFRKFFSGPFATIKQAQAAHQQTDLFQPAAVCRTVDGVFVLTVIREQAYPPHATAAGLKRDFVLEMVSCSDGLLGVWKPYVAPDAEGAPA